jgi:hypothetical protein
LHQVAREVSPRVAPIESTINRFLPPSERYGTDEPILVENGDGGPSQVMGFTEAQMDVLAETLGQEITSLRTSKTNESCFKTGLARTIRSMAGRLSHRLSRYLSRLR